MTTDNSHDRFEDRLLAQLRDVVAQNPSPAAASAPASPASPAARSRAPRLALATAGTAAAAVAVALVATGGDGSTAKAYDVTEGDGGEVSVTIRSLDDAEGLQRTLRAAGVPAVVCQGAPDGALHLAKPPADGAKGAHVTRGAKAGVGVAAAGGDDGPTTVGPEGSKRGPIAVERGLKSDDGARSASAGGASDDGPESASVPAAAGVPQVEASLSVRTEPDGTSTFTVHRGDVPSGEHLYIATAGEDERTSVSVGIASGGGVSC